MTASVDIDVDIYGKYARLSAVADWMEKLATAQINLSEADLADYIADSKWRFPDIWVTTDSYDGEQDEEGEEDQDDLSRARKAARSVFAVLEERADLLGVAYPFILQDNRIELRSGVELQENPYAAVWAVTLCHAYGLVDSPSPTQVFEEVVAQALVSDRVVSVNFGELRRRSGTFPKALIAAGELLEVPASPEGAIWNRRAQDEKADTICHLSWGDMRPGLWCLVGQATCAKSEEWQAKMAETAIVPWMKWLGTWLLPTAFLAVPHHVENVHMARLVESGQRIVLDRLRLTIFKNDVSSNERILIQAALSAEAAVP